MRSFHTSGGRRVSISGSNWGDLRAAGSLLRFGSMRDPEKIDDELRRLVAIRRMFQEQTGESGSTDRIDVLLDERYRATRETATGLPPGWLLDDL